MLDHQPTAVFETKHVGGQNHASRSLAVTEGQDVLVAKNGSHVCGGPQLNVCDIEFHVRSGLPRGVEDTGPTLLNGLPAAERVPTRMDTSDIILV